MPGMKDRLIMALDVETVDKAEGIIKQLDGIVSFFKIGPCLCMAEGVDKLYHMTTTGGRRLFLDTKIFDVPETVRQAIKTVVKRGVSFVTVHGDSGIMSAAVEAKAGSNLKVFAVTTLTNLSDDTLQEMGFRLNARDLVRFRVKKAVEAKCDGIIASADDDSDCICELAQSADILIATYGVGRSPDQKRTITPREAILNGADYLVVVCGIVSHPQHDAVRSAALEIIKEMQSGWDERQSIFPARQQPY